MRNYLHADETVPCGRKGERLDGVVSRAVLAQQLHRVAAGR